MVINLYPRIDYCIHQKPLRNRQKKIRNKRMQSETTQATAALHPAVAFVVTLIRGVISYVNSDRTAVQSCTYCTVPGILYQYYITLVHPTCGFSSVEENHCSYILWYSAAIHKYHHRSITSIDFRYILVQRVFTGLKEGILS